MVKVRPRCQSDRAVGLEEPILEGEERTIRDRRSLGVELRPARQYAPAGSEPRLDPAQEVTDLDTHLSWISGEQQTLVNAKGHRLHYVCRGKEPRSLQGAVDDSESLSSQLTHKLTICRPYPSPLA